MDAMQRIAMAIMQGQGHQQPARPSVTVKATPPQLPNYQIPGLTDFQLGVGGAQDMPGAIVNMAQNPPAAPAPAPMPAPAADPVMPDLPPMPPTQQIGVAPGMAAQGMVKMPQTNAELEQWRQMMDALQFGRQGL